MADETPEVAYELRYRRECYRRDRGEMVRLEERERELPERPFWFKPTFGSYAEIAKKAVKANEAQLHAGFLDYLFWPDVVVP